MENTWAQCNSNILGPGWSSEFMGVHYVMFHNTCIHIDIFICRYQIKNTLKKNKRKTFEGILVGSHMFSLFLGGKKLILFIMFCNSFFGCVRSSVWHAGLSSCGDRLSCPAACWIFLDRGSNLRVPWTGRRTLNHWTLL